MPTIIKIKERQADKLYECAEKVHRGAGGYCDDDDDDDDDDYIERRGVPGTGRYGRRRYGRGRRY